MEPRLNQLKALRRGMGSYVLMLYEFVREMKPQNILEIGVQYGQSTKTILLALKMNGGGRLVSIDHKSRETILDEEYPDLKQYWNFNKASSHDPIAVQLAKESLPEGELYDLFLIDGDHTYEGVKQDFEDFVHLVKPGGVVMLHDTTNHRAGVNQFWNEIPWPEKFNLDWGHAAKATVPGMGLCRKPLT